MGANSKLVVWPLRLWEAGKSPVASCHMVKLPHTGYHWQQHCMYIMYLSVAGSNTLATWELVRPLRKGFVSFKGKWPTMLMILMSRLRWGLEVNSEMQTQKVPFFLSACWQHVTGSCWKDPSFEATNRVFRWRIERPLDWRRLSHCFELIGILIVFNLQFFKTVNLRTVCNFFCGILLTQHPPNLRSLPGTHLHVPRRAGEFCPGAAETSAGGFKRHQLLHAPTLVLGESSDSLDSNLRQSGGSCAMLETPKERTREIASPLHDRLPDTPVGTPSTVFTIDYSTGWHGFLPSICRNFDWSQHGLEDTDGTLFRFKDSEGTLDATPEPTAFPVRVIALTPEQKGLPETYPQPDTLVDEEFASTNGTPASKSPATGEGGESSGSKPEQSNVGAPTGSKQKDSQDDNGENEKPNMYEDGTYWKNLVCKQFQMMICSTSSECQLDLPYQPPALFQRA